MNNLRRFIPLLILIVVLAFFLYPSQDNAVSSTAEPAAAAMTDTLSLVNSEAAAVTETSSRQRKTQVKKPEASANPVDEKESEVLLPEDGSYTTKEDVSLYLVQYGHLPCNFITKKEAQKAGWSGGSLEKVLPGMCIGGDYFGNYEGKLPKAKGRTWTECDINTLGKKSRGAERLIFSNDGLIYYTDDHYDSFTQLY